MHQLPRKLLYLCLLATLALAPVAQGDNGAANRLLLPYFEVDTRNPSGISTLFAIRNLEFLDSIIVAIDYYDAATPEVGLPRHTDVVTLTAGEVHTINLRSVPDLTVDADGFARGWVLFEVISAIFPSSVDQLAGDYFQVEPGENFASGGNLIPVDADSDGNDLCSILHVRFFNGGAFDGGTEFLVFRTLYSPLFPTAPELSIDVWDESGNFLETIDVPLPNYATKLRTQDLDLPVNFGALDFVFNSQQQDAAYVTAVFRASGRFSARVDGTCR